MAKHSHTFDADTETEIDQRVAAILRAAAAAMVHRALTKTRNSTLNIIWKRLTAAARQAGYDPENHDELLRFAANEGRPIAEEYVAAGGKEFRKLTRREGL